MKPLRSTRRFAFALSVGLVVAACTEQPSAFTEPGEVQDVPEISVVSRQALGPAIDVQMRHTDALMRVPGVVGTAVGVTPDGLPSIKILAAGRLDGVPSTLEGIPVEVDVTGEFFALQGQAMPQAKPTCGRRGLPPCAPPLNARHPRPVPIGVSTGHPAITAGTIGARVTDGSNVFALSNNHVYADINAALLGDAVIQPGTFDGGSSPADDIGDLFDFEPIVFSGCTNVIDAAIASTTTSLVGNAAPAGVGYGTPRTATLGAAINMKVKKVGRTTGFTKGTVAAINATVNVNYGVGVACFVNQIIVTPGSFSAGGDSGSLIVADRKGRTKQYDRRPVGLLYAGSATQTIANPIDAVLARFGVTIDGN